MERKMRVLITENGGTDHKGNSVDKGMTISVPDDEIPAGLVNKCQILPNEGKREKGGKTMVVNPADTGGDVVTGIAE